MSFFMNKTAVLFLCLCGMAHAQAQGSGVSSPFGTDPSARPQQGGSATRGEFAPVLDSEKRPITAGGFVKTGPVIFKNIAEKAGLTTWRHTMGTPEKNYILETTGSGVALLDYDNDGWLDIYLVNGSTFDALTGKTEPPQSAPRSRKSSEGIFLAALHVHRHELK
jgi:enediyne biosynthesis protein E4